jgi:lipoprotein-anchoring transpeptidase ErfK/SrfK
MIGWCYVATGKEGRGTPAGNYFVMEKIVDKHSNKYGWVSDELGNVTNPDATPSVILKPGEKYNPAPMPYWQRLTSYGIGLHVGLIPQPGEPASHGCIRMPKDFSPLLYSVTKVGTPVKIMYGPQEPVIPWQ